MAVLWDAFLLLTVNESECDVGNQLQAFIGLIMMETGLAAFLMEVMFLVIRLARAVFVTRRRLPIGLLVMAYIKIYLAFMTCFPAGYYVLREEYPDLKDSDKLDFKFRMPLVYDYERHDRIYM